MKGIVIAGDSGRRLFPITIGIPKQLLPIYDQPMVYYPIRTLASAGVTDIMIITTSEQQSAFMKSLGRGEQFDCHFFYAVQDEPNGIAEAISIGSDFFASESVCLITGDTIIIGDTFPEQLKKAFRAVTKSGNATIFVSSDRDPSQYGKVIANNLGRNVKIVGDSEENNYYSIAGLYVFPKTAIEQVAKISKSERGLLEITSLSQLFQEDNKLQIQKLSDDCKWLDTNTFDNILKCGSIIRQLHKG